MLACMDASIQYCTRIHTDMYTVMYSQVFSVVGVDADGKDLVVVGTCLLSCASLPPPAASLLVI